MVLRIDPRLSLVWRSPHELQVGADRPGAVLGPLDVAEERLVAALRVGTTRHALVVIAGECGAPRSTVDGLLDRLGAAVLPEAAPRATLTVAVEHGRRAVLDDATGLLAGALRRAGATLADGGTDPVGLAVLLAAHVTPPVAAARWLARDVPHLPVVFGDEGVEVGPLVLPGRTACLHCTARHRMDADPPWAAVAAQLLEGGHPAAAAGAPMLVHAAAAEVLRVMCAMRDGRPSGREGSSVRIDAEGRITELRWPPHPGCSCRALPGSATDPAALHGADRPLPRTAAARIVPA